MKTRTTTNLKLLLSIFLLGSNVLKAQIKKQFSPRFSEGIHGNVTMIANNVLSRSATGSYIGEAGNHDFNNNVFVDIDSDVTTFNSSSANLINPEPSISCLTIKKAYLYWAAADLKEKDPRDEPNWNYNMVKLMLPGSSNYQNFIADEVIFRGRDEVNNFVNDPYVCFKDITKEVENLSNPYGKYQIANVKAKQGELISHLGNNTGTSGGWQILFIYENPKLPSKNISIFDGYANVTKYVNNFDIQFDGFLTVPNGDVNAEVVLGALEGDRDLTGDKLQIKDVNNNWVNLAYGLRDENNFFNSRISKNGSDFIDRNPASTNTLGFDADIFTLNNTNNTIIKNNQTATTIRLTSNQETYGLFLLGFSVDVWKPDLAPLLLTIDKPINTAVTVNDEITFSAEVKNLGNDDVKDLEMVAEIPKGTTLVEPIIGLPTGISYRYNSGNRKLTFIAEKGITDVKDTAYVISFKVKVKDQCYFLEALRAINLEVQLVATYNGVLNNSIQITKSSSSNNDCGIGNEKPTVFSISKPDKAKWITDKNFLNRTISCDDDEALVNAQALTPEASCNLKKKKITGVFTSSAECSTNGTYVNTWTFVDSYGRVSEVYEQTITIIDEKAPVFNENLPETEIAVNCDAVPEAAVLTATDNCDTSVTVNYSEEIKNQNASCASNYTIVRTWTVSDCSGNSTTHSQTVKVSDTTAPVFTESLPETEIAVSCDAVPEAAVLTATDNCDTSVVVNYTEEIKNQNASCTSNYTIIRNWTVSDCSGNSTAHSQTVKVSDTTAPVFTEGLPEIEIAVSCDTIPVAAVLTAKDNCDLEVTVNYSEEIKNQNASCTSNYTIVRNWTISDCSGNSTTHSQIVKVSDTIAPVFNESLPEAEIATSCDAVPEAAVLTATDNCDSSVVVNYSEEIQDQNASCISNYTIIRNWTVSDCSGNSTTHSQTVKVNDTTAPVFTESLPESEITASCDAVPEATILTATDNCDTEVTVNYSEEIKNQDASCTSNYTIIRNWTVSDCSGNSTTHSQTVKVSDTTAPVFTESLPEIEIAMSCDAVPVAAVLTATDNCDSNVTVNYTEETKDQDTNCASNYTIIRTWTVSDCSGNSTTHSQTVKVSDTTAPVFTESLPETEIEASCDTIPEAAVLTATDNCDTSVTVNYSEEIKDQNASCISNYTIVRNWTISDCSGNSTTHSQTVKVSDTTAPVFTESLPEAEIIASCDAIPVAAVLTATDNCDTSVIVNYSEEIKDQNASCTSNYTIIRNWTVSDCSGNSTTHSQTVKVSDTTAPVFTESLPEAEITASCNAVPEAAVLTATDNCDTSVIVNYTEEIQHQNASCTSNYTIIRNWIVSDCSGNSTTHSQTVKVSDTNAPVFTESLPKIEIVVSCDAVPEAAILTATDNCDLEVTVNYSEEIKDQNASCISNYTIVRNWTISDCSGNSTTHSQTVKVSDIIAPVFTEILPEAEITASCDDIPIAAILTATDNCDSEVTVNYSEEIKDQDASCTSNYIIIRNWTVSDCSGNSTTHSQTVKVSDTIASELLSTLEDITVMCNEIPDIPELEFQDNCSENVTQIDFTETNTFDGTNNDYEIIREWLVGDSCGNNATFTQIITVIIENNEVEENETVFKCIDDGDINLNDYLTNQNNDGTWEVTSGEAVINDGIFNPLNSDLGDYVFTYSVLNEGCLSSIKVRININEDCSVLPCGRKDIKISKVVTPNHDAWNEYFKVTDECSFITGVQLFNRWGTKIYKSSNYKNDWNGLAMNSSFGGDKYLPAGTYYYIVVLKDSGLKPFTGAIYLGTK